MKSQAFLWTFDFDDFPSSKNSAFSSNYILPNTGLKIDPESLAGSRVWLITELEGSLCSYGVLQIEAVEKILEGLNADSFLLRANPLKSFGLFKDKGDHNSWIVDGVLEKEKASISMCRPEIDEMLWKFIHTKAPKSRVLLNDRVIENFPLTKISDISTAIIDQMMLLLRHKCLHDLPQCIDFQDMSGFGAAVYKTIKTLYQDLDGAFLLSEIRAVDPLHCKSTPSRTLPVSPSTASRFDPIFEPIIPEKITSRSLVAAASSYSIDWLDKTEEAEKSHQDIVRDLSAYLLGCGFKVSESRSVDLLVSCDNYSALIEVKSATAENLVNQGEKGIIQALRYEIELKKLGTEPDLTAVIIQYIPSEDACQYLMQLGKRVGIELFFYNPDFSWPERGGGFHELPVFSGRCQ